MCVWSPPHQNLDIHIMYIYMYMYIYIHMDEYVYYIYMYIHMHIILYCMRAVGAVNKRLFLFSYL